MRQPVAGWVLAIWEDGVTLLFSYLGLMVLGDLSAYFVGLIVERQWLRSAFSVKHATRALESNPT